jgi:hypothetical protein
MDAKLAGRGGFSATSKKGVKQSHVQYKAPGPVLHLSSSTKLHDDDLILD